MNIIPIEYGRSVLQESLIFQGGDREKVYDIPFKIYLIKLNNRNILVDAGCETMPGFEMRNFIGSVKALENLGVTPDEVTDVIITHSHHDHIECIKYFKNALIHIQKDEFDTGKDYIPEGFKVNVFNDCCFVYECIKVVKIGGHSKGSCIVEINDAGNTYILAGDECYLRACLTNKNPTGTSFCPEKSREFVEKYSNKKYTVLLCHSC